MTAVDLLNVFCWSVAVAAGARVGWMGAPILVDLPFAILSVIINSLTRLWIILWRRA